jgi:integrase
MDEQTLAVVPIDQVPVTTIQVRSVGTSYDDELARLGQLANTVTATNVFIEYHKDLAANTLQAQRETLQLFSIFLATGQAIRRAEDLYIDPEAWRGITAGLLKLFRTWLLDHGYSLTTLKQRLSIIRQYCILAHQAKVIPDEEHNLILAVKSYNGKAGQHIDARRTDDEVPVRKSTKKAIPTRVLTSQAHRLKRATTKPVRARRKHQDVLLTERDGLLMGLLIEHALRASEVAALDIEFFDLKLGRVLVFSPKNGEPHLQKLKNFTRRAAERYLLACGRSSGPLFVGYKGKRITRYGIYNRVKMLGRQVGIEKLSPHDLRHFFVLDALANGTSLDRVQSGGNWKSPYMVLRYAKSTGIANEGVNISEAQDGEDEEDRGS